MFLISGAVINVDGGENPVTYLRFLEEAAKEINYGGSLFYLINPLKQKKRGRGSDLKFMADAAGGKFISGTGMNDIVTQVKNSTSAYYELAFSPPPSAAGKKSRIEIKCKRKGVELTTIAHSEKERPYRSMKNMEKRMFVLNVINGGSWSRMTASVKQVKYKSTGRKSKKKQCRRF